MTLSLRQLLGALVQAIMLHRSNLAQGVLLHLASMHHVSGCEMIVPLVNMCQHVTW